MGFIFGEAGRENPGWLLNLEEESSEISTLLCAGVRLEVHQNYLEGEKGVCLFSYLFTHQKLPFCFKVSVKKMLLSVQPEMGNALCCLLLERVLFACFGETGKV